MGTFIAIAGMVGLFFTFKSALNDLRRRVKKAEESEEEIQTMKTKVTDLYDAINKLIEYLSTKHEMSDLRSAIELKRQITEFEKKSTSQEKAEQTLPIASPLPQPSPQPSYSSPKVESKAETTMLQKDIGSQPSTTLPSWTPPQIDWEKFTGIKLFAWLGGLALFLGAVFFVKYSIDHGLLSPIVRVILGLIVGTGCIVGAIRGRDKGYNVTVQTLAAAGVAILYADTFAAYSLFHFIPNSVALLFMIVVTILSFFLAVRLDSKYVALLGLLGGFLTPPLLSTGVDRPFGLFSYIALLDMGLAAVALRKRWNWLLGLAASATVIMQIGWTAKFFAVQKLMTAQLIYVAFPVLFAVVYEWARRIKRDEIWTRSVAGAFPFVPFCINLFLLSYPEVASQPYLLFGFLFIQTLLTAFLAFRAQNLEWSHGIAGLLSFIVLLSWTVSGLTYGLLSWGLLFYLLFAGAHAAYPVVLKKLRPTTPPFALSSIFPLLMLGLLLIPLAQHSVMSFWMWPVVFILGLLAVASATVVGGLWVLLAGFGTLVLTVIAMLFWILGVPNAAGLNSFFVVVGIFTLAFFAGGLFLVRHLATSGLSEKMAAHFKEWGIAPDFQGVLNFPSFATLLPFILLIVASAQPFMESPAPIFGLGCLLILLLVSLVHFQKVDVLALLALFGIILVQLAWFQTHFQKENVLSYFPWSIGFMLFFYLLPFFYGAKSERRPPLWIASALSGPLHFYLLYKGFDALFGLSFIGILPAFLAVVYLLGLVVILRTHNRENPFRLGSLAWFGGVGLFFITLIFPLQFDREWITLGWALEGAALVWLYQRIPHKGLKGTGAALLVVAFIRLAVNPAVLDYHPRTAIPIWNWYLYAYGLAAACLFVGAYLWTKKDDWPPHFPVHSILNGLGAVLSFLLLNIEIADYFSTGTSLTFEFSGNLARDMTYSLGWGLFATVLLVVGIRNNNRGARYGSLGLLLVTVMKLFFHDLWRLGQLYRVGSFVGLAGVLILVSFLYQKFVVPADRQIKNGTQGE